MKYQYKMFIETIKHFLLYRVPNMVLRYLFGDRNGVYETYESIKYRNMEMNLGCFRMVIKVGIAFIISIFLLPFIVVYNVVCLFILRKVYLPRIEVGLTTHCSLKCKDCSNLIQYYDRPYHIDADSIIQAIENLTGTIDAILQLVLLGGEPLIYPDFVKILNYANASKKIKTICIKTNGVCKLSDEMITALKNPKVHLDVSDYGVRSEIVQKNCKIFCNEKIAYFCQDRKPWFDMGSMNKRNRSAAQLEDQYRKCGYKCKGIFNGKLYVCPRSSHGTDLGFFEDKIYVDLMKTAGSRKKMRKKILFVYYYDKPIVACDWCDAGTEQCTSIPCGIQVEAKE